MTKLMELQILHHLLSLMRNMYYVNLRLMGKIENLQAFNESAAVDYARKEERKAKDDFIEIYEENISLRKQIKKLEKQVWND